MQYTTLKRAPQTRTPVVERAARTEALHDPQAMGEVIEKLEKMRLLKRVSHPNHRRVYPAVLLPKGVEQRNARVAELEATMLRDPDDDQRLEMVRALTSAVQALGAGLPRHVR